MKALPETIRFTARLQKPAEARATWCFVVLPSKASERLPSRSMVSVDGVMRGHSFHATLEPDGQGSHWFKVPARLRIAAGVEAGDSVQLSMTPVTKEPEPRVPLDLRKALAASPQSTAVWNDITPVARRDWIHWITSAKKSETRARRVANACDMLASGKRRACCFDRSGMYSKSLAAPRAAG